VADARSQRRQKRLAKQKKKRDRKSRPARDRNPTAPAAVDAGAAAHWPTGPCYLSDNWYERGAQVDVLVSRVASSGEAAVASITVDLAGEGVQRSQARGGLRGEHVPGEAARLSDEGGRAMIDVAPAQAVAVIAAGLRLGGTVDPATTALIQGIDPDDAPIEVLTGEPTAPPPPKEEGWFSRLVGKIVGSP